VKFPPQYIEGKLKFSPYIKDCMAMGGKERPYVGAIIAIDFEVCGRWAEAHTIPYTTITDLSQKDQICELIKKEINAVNQTLPEAQQVKKFVNLYKEFDPDEAELTRTRKLRRSFMEERYKGLIEALYGDKGEYAIEAPVVYRDGRTGVVKTVIKVNSV
jgi:long-chain acyl-CoA synthetase